MTETEIKEIELYKKDKNMIDNDESKQNVKERIPIPNGTIIKKNLFIALN